MRRQERLGYGKGGLVPQGAAAGFTGLSRPGQAGRRGA